MYKVALNKLYALGLALSLGYLISLYEGISFLNGFLLILVLQMLFDQYLIEQRVSAQFEFSEAMHKTTTVLTEIILSSLKSAENNLNEFRPTDSKDLEDESLFN